MRVSINSVLTLAAVLFVLLLGPQAASASTADCPVEPKMDVPIADGEVFAGPNCDLYTANDVDSFQFEGTSGDTYQLAAAINGAAPADVCLTLYSPTAVQIFSGCTFVLGGQYSVVTDQKLTSTGMYTMDITETGTGTLNYAASLERLYPFPPNAQQIQLGKSVSGDISELTDSNAFTFQVVTTGTYQVSATLPGNASNDLCMTVYLPTGASAGSACTFILGGTYTAKVDFTPSQAGTSMTFLSVAGNDGTATYSLEASCLAGTCTMVYPPCTLTDVLTYNSSTSTLTMNFTVGNNEGTTATWNGWLTYQNTLTNLFSISQPITNPPVPITKTYTGLPAEGKVGVLSTLTTPTKGITCSSWQQINTGTGP